MVSIAANGANLTREDVMAHIMIVEDMAMIALEISEIVEDLGHEVVLMSGSVDDALEKLSAADLSLDAVLLDANLHDRSAAPVAQKLRELGIPFVIASGYSRSDLVEFGNGVRLAKPFSKQQLAAALVDVVGPAPASGARGMQHAG